MPREDALTDADNILDGELHKIHMEGVHAAAHGIMGLLTGALTHRQAMIAAEAIYQVSRIKATQMGISLEEFGERQSLEDQAITIGWQAGAVAQRDHDMRVDPATGKPLTQEENHG